ncbi:MAG: serine hydrolase, partial [Candidatus Aminicenantes bacterium]|nr:serine hydrolase [Candidatus Aminicenantes bacterium]
MRERHNRLRTLAIGIVVVLGILIPRAAGAAAKEPAGLPPGLDAEIARIMKAFEVPGLGLAVVKDGAVLTAKGYGVRKLGAPEPVDARTLFAIASNTKVFTAVALGLLVEEGKLEWDGPVVRWLPWFQLADPYVTRELTVRDLLVHRSGLGLGAGDLLIWPPSNLSRTEIVRRLRHVPLRTSFRNAYAYDNVLFLAAGEVIRAVSGKTWEEFVTERILKKTGMDGSVLRQDDFERAPNRAAAHAPIDGIVREVKAFETDAMSPAGGIASSAADMAKWVRVLLAKGVLPDGTRLFSEATARELMSIVTPIPIGTPAAELAVLRRQFNGYALGLNVHDYRGRKVVTHTGGLAGFVSKVTMIPDLDLGVVVLTNQESSEAFMAATFHILDSYLSAPRTDWTAAYLAVRARNRAETADAVGKAAAARDASSKPSLPVDRYAGLYRDAWYGDVAIATEGGRLVIRFAHTPALVG